MPRQPSPIYQIKITLNEYRPAIWRRFQVPGSITLGKLHDVVQIVMGWSDSHLHQFSIDGQSYGSREDDDPFDGMRSLPEHRYRLEQLVPVAHTRFQYEYDFGDSWEHTLLVEKILPQQPGAQLAQCLAG